MTYTAALFTCMAITCHYERTNIYSATLTFQDPGRTHL